MGKLDIDPGRVARARELAQQITAPVQEYVGVRTTDTVERATLRLLGCDRTDAQGTPVPNLVVSQVRERLGGGAARWYVNGLIATGSSPEDLDLRIAKGLDLTSLPLADEAALQARAAELLSRHVARVRAHKDYRAAQISACADKEHSPLLYVIVATGNIYEDVKQAEAAAVQGADVVAVIRTTAQSLLDYVPYGPTTEGFGGTYATQENFRIMREKLDEVGERIGKYVRLVNYASGLCMPEIAAMGALERLDMMLNDSMYGVLFRDINPERTFIDQHFSRMIGSFADIVINTGEDNYLTTSDAVENAHTVLASQLINEQFAFRAGMPSRLQGLGHAFEIDPEIENGFLYEMAQAQLAREIFPQAPLKYMPPTKYMDGDIFRGYALNTLFNFVGRSTGQNILLLGMLTEAIHTPFMQDRFLALTNARYVLKTAAAFGNDIEFKSGGIMQQRAALVLNKAVTLLEDVDQRGLFGAIEAGLFADIKRTRAGGKGYAGVHEKTQDYWNPVEDFLVKELKLGGVR